MVDFQPAMLVFRGVTLGWLGASCSQLSNEKSGWAPGRLEGIYESIQPSYIGIIIHPQSLTARP